MSPQPPARETPPLLPTPGTATRPGHRLLRTAASVAVRLLARLFTGVTARWTGVAPIPEQRIYFANHRSHFDAVLIWAALPVQLRAATRPVAGADYWLADRLRRFIARDVFNAVLIPRGRLTRGDDPTTEVLAVLDTGASLIIFPEGTRNTGDEALLPFKSGLYRLAAARPGIALVPVWIENVGRVMPKGELIPVPLLCSVTFGPAQHIEPGEPRPHFLARMQQAVCALAPTVDRA